MKKFSLFFILYSILLSIFVFYLFNYDRVTGPDPLSLTFIFSLAPYIFMAVMGAMWSHEQWEDKTNAYAFLATLPIKTADIVYSKFILVFLSVVFYVGFHCVALAVIAETPEFLVKSSRYMIMNGNICLIFAGFLYLGIFRYGFTKFGKFILASWIVLFIGPLIFMVVLLPKVGIERVEIIEWVTGQNWMVFTVISIAVFWSLMRIASKQNIAANYYGV